MSPAAAAALGHFQRHMALERALSPHTCSAYGRDLATLASFCDRQGIQHWRDLKHVDVRAFAASEHRRGLSAGSIQRALGAVRSFLNFLIREGVLGANVAHDIPTPRMPRRLPHVLDVDQVAQLLDISAYRDQDPHAVRDKAIMELLYSSALRLAELLNLDCADVDLASGQVRVLGKGSKERIVPVGSYAIAAIREWLPMRRRIAEAGEAALFVGVGLHGRRGRRLTGRAIQQRIAHWAKVKRIPVHVHPHIFRHSCATHLLEASGDIRYVQEFLGHASISKTAIYTHLNFTHLATIYDAAHPRARLKPVSSPAPQTTVAAAFAPATPNVAPYASA